MDITPPQQSTQKKPLVMILVIVGILIVLGAAAAVLLWYTSPQRTMNAFLHALESKNKDAAMALVSETTESNKQENVQWFVEDWVTAQTIHTETTKNESWRSHTMMMEENGQQVPKKNKYGYEEKEWKPTPKYFAHHYQAYVTVKFSDGEDEFEDPVIIKLKRDTDDSWSIFSQLFRGWKVTNIKYQPIDEDDFETLNFDEGGDESDTNGEFELDENGNLIAPDSTEEANDTTETDENSEGNDETTTDSAAEEN